MRSERARSRRENAVHAVIAEIALSDPYDSGFPCANHLHRPDRIMFYSFSNEIRIDDNSAPMILARGTLETNDVVSRFTVR